MGQQHMDHLVSDIQSGSVIAVCPTQPSQCLAMARPADAQPSTVALTVVARSRLFTDLLWQCWQCWPLLHDGLLLHLQYSFLQQQGRPSASGYCQVQRIWVLIISCSLLLWGCGFVFLTPELTLYIFM